VANWGSRLRVLTMATEVFKSNFLNSLIRPQRLLRQFGLAAFVMILGGMTATGAWLTSEIHNGIVKHTTLSTAVFMERFVQPLILELRTNDHFSNTAIENLDNLVRRGLIAKHVVSIKIWRTDGTVAFSTDRSIIGKTFAIEDALETAVNGEIGTEYGELLAAENVFERTLNKKLIEIYVPMVEDETGRVFAISEFYVDADALPADLQRRYFKSWFVVGLVTLAMLLPLYFIVRRGDKTIAAQEVAIRKRVVELSGLLSENRELNTKVEQANRQSASVNERFLNRLGADLHDGPVQMLAVAILWLDSLTTKKTRSTKENTDDTENVQLIRSTINDALKEVRSLAKGLVLPELAKSSLAETLSLVIDAHKMRTKTAVELDCRALPELRSATLNDTIYRFVQEGLSNAFRHAGGRGQKVTASVEHQMLSVEVSDSGQGFNVRKEPSLPSRLGLSGMRNRITTIGGQFEILSSKSSGTVLKASIPLDCITVENVPEKTESIPA
jgi:signal transduction histidine kinase